MSYQIFDGHNDVLFRLFLKNKIDAHEDFLQGDNEGHLDLPRMEELIIHGHYYRDRRGWRWCGRSFHSRIRG